MNSIEKIKQLLEEGYKPVRVSYCIMANPYEPPYELLLEKGEFKEVVSFSEKERNKVKLLLKEYGQYNSIGSLL